MGKHTRPRVSDPSGHPVWGLMLHVVKCPDWNYVKKRHSHTKHEFAGDEKTRNKNTSKLQETSNDQVESSQVRELSQGATTDKSSVKALIKSLVNEEFYKRKKGQHLQASTYPMRSRLTRINAIHRLNSSHGDFLVEITSTDESPETANKSNDDSKTTISVDLLPKMSFGEPIATIESGEGCQVDENDRQHIENHWPIQENLEDESKPSLEQSLINAKDITTDALLYQSKEFVDAVDTRNMKKEISDDPSTPFACHFYNPQTLNAGTVVSQSDGFPLPGLSGRRVSGPSQLKNKEDDNRSCKKEEDVYQQTMPSTVVECREDVIQKANPAAADIADSSFSDSAHHSNNPRKNEVVIKRFKDLQQKIKHAIKERKNEWRQITMDAILHKIPHFRGFSKDLNNEVLDQLKDTSMMSDSKRSPSMSLKSDQTALVGKRCHSMRRISSLNERVDRYCQLYESAFNREARQPISEGLKLRREDETSSSRDSAKSLGRIFSLPEVKSYYHLNEDLSGACSSLIPVRIPAKETGNSSVGEQDITDMPLDSDYCSRLDNPAEIQIQENLVEVCEPDSCSGDQVGSTSVADSFIEMDKPSDDLITLTTRDSASDCVWDVKAKATEPSPVTVFDCNSQGVGESTGEFSFSEESEEMLEFQIPDVHDCLTGHQCGSNTDAPLMVQSLDFEKEESLPHVQVDAKDKAKFDYVKYILELTDFIGNEPLGTWYSDDQPLDPSIYDEVGGCILLDPDCSENEDGKCNHAFFFDLINEVLMEIYERSNSFYPKPLSSQCHIPQMPAGNRVLKEVWRNISGYLSWRSELDDQSSEYIMSIDLSKNDGWMNLQFYSERVVLEVEDLIFNELLQELIY